MNDVYKQYIPKTKDLRKELAKKEIDKLTHTTYGLERMKVSCIQHLIQSTVF